ncbi:putative tyrosine-protein phosphatase TPTE isoform X2 [Dysidea avara]
MSFPSRRRESVSKGHSNEISRFLEDKYPGHFKIYNLCVESYDSSRFQYRVASYPFEAHNPPSIELIQVFCQDMDEWLNADDDNVAVVHCKDGLGRTGTMVCSYLLHNGVFDGAKEVLQFFGEARAQNKEGVSVPSQRRYVRYYGYLLNNNLQYHPKTVLLQSIKLIGIPNVLSFTPYFTVTLQKVKMYTSKVYNHIKKSDAFAELMLPQELPLCGDVKVEFFHQSIIGQKEKLFTFWFNTFFTNVRLNQQADISFRCSTLNVKEYFPSKRPVSHVLSEKIGETLNRSFGLSSPKFSEESRIRSLSLSNLDNTVHSKIDNIVSSVLNKECSKSTDISAGTKNMSEKFMYKDVQMTKKQLRKAFKSAGRKAGVDITTGCTRLIHKPVINNPVLLEYRRNALHPIMVNDDDSDGSGNSTRDTPPELITQEQTTLVLPHSELDHAYKDKKRYPNGFQVHLILSTLGHSVSSEDVSIERSGQVDEHVSNSGDDSSDCDENDNNIEEK